jgi:hypothetical protein
MIEQQIAQDKDAKIQGQKERYGHLPIYQQEGGGGFTNYSQSNVNSNQAIKRCFYCLIQYLSL